MIFFGDKLRAARQHKNFTQKQFGTLLGVSNAVISNWEKDINRPDIDTLEIICKALEINPNYFFDTSGYNILSENEWTHITKYRRLDVYGKEAVDSTLNIELKRLKEEHRKREEFLKAQEAANKDNTDKIIEIPEQKIWVLPCYDIAASAGTGTPLEDADCTPMVLKSEPPRNAAFVVPVTGNSMTPKFHDGDFVFVRPQPTVEIGQIGIFYHDGGSYIKQLGNGELVSLNPEYSNIKIIDEYTHCFGRVLGVYKPDNDVEN